MVELVTLAPEQLTQGVMSGTFGTALSHARTMLPDEREASWIRTANEVLTFAQAEERFKGKGDT